MRGRNPRDKKKLTIDLLERLVSCRYRVPEEPIPREDVLSWFIEEEQELAAKLVDRLVKGEAPVETAGPDDEQIGVTSLAAAQEHIESLRETPWYDI